ncbi:MAG: hypothetical protein NVV70_06495 [Cellulomonas sp.]|uniref:hypothetical protein n=1 Tax=Cellulomonas sp. TaxID=40001 RepID=UPI00258CE140|nr:hypothetical protein [Cellulomonas sp.]MCR6647793.1 hypothetical protein [Cellulomonas sp.]MCR6703151.1 hypothetical protein [Cellulomonas sp.]
MSDAPGAGAPGGGLDTTEIRALLRGLEDLPAELHKEVRTMLRPLGQDLLHAAAANAAAWSSRIPHALSMRVVLKGSMPGIVIRASLAKAPHARAMEGLLDDVFRHPLFGMDVWFDQRARPYMLPAIDAAYPRIQSDVNDVLAAVHRRVGLA